MKLDKKYKKLLYELELNSRQSLSELAKKVGLSKQAIDYRLKSLIEKKIVSQFYTIINFSKLGYTSYKLYVKFQSIDLEKEREIIEYWVQSRHTIWVASCRGPWDLGVSILAKNAFEVGSVLNEFLNRYSLFVLEKNLLITQLSPIFTKIYLNEQKEKKEFVYSGKIQNYELDKKEKQILRLMAVNARIPILELAQKTGLSRDVVSYRLKKLEKDGVIVQYRSLVDSNKIGFRLYKILLQLHNFSAEKEAEMKAFVKQKPNGLQFLKLLGSWDVELEFEVENEDQLYGLLLEIRKKFSAVLRNYDTLLVHQTHKLNFYPF